MHLYISDLHFGHKGVIQFDHRPFRDVNEMDRTLIQLWNSRVRPEDHVHIVGDFACQNEREEQWYLRQLKGYKHLIVGNHDDRLLNNAVAMSYFESVDNLTCMEDNGRQVVICHYPLADWGGGKQGAYLVYGHIHSSRDEVFEFMTSQRNALNAGACINNYTPASINELIRNNRIFQNGK